MTKKAIQAAIEFLQNDEARDLLGLHRLRVDGQLRTRGELADLLHVALAQCEVPQKAAQENASLTFGQAIEALRKGECVARAGWNGKGMWLGLVQGYEYNPDEGRATVYALGCQKLPWIGMKTADGCFVPWLASQTDMLAEDWAVVH